MRRLEPIDARQRHVLGARYGCTLATLRGVDRGVGRIYHALEKQGELENTVFIFWSDNGYFNGEHRIVNKKQLQYEEGVRVPLAIRVGSDVESDGKSRKRVGRPVANIDIAPTILDYAGGDTCRGKRCRAMDGLSMRGLIRGKSSPIRKNRPLVIEFDNQPRSKSTCAYEGVRTPSSAWIVQTSIPDRDTAKCHPAHEVELYDLKKDPYQLRNRAPAKPGSPEHATQQRMRRLLSRLADCSGIKGRDRKPNGGRHFCGSER